MEAPALPDNALDAPDGDANPVGAEEGEVPVMLPITQTGEMPPIGPHVAYRRFGVRNFESKMGDPFSQLRVDPAGNPLVEPNDSLTRTEPLAARPWSVAVSLNARAFCYLIQNPPEMSEANIPAWRDWSNNVMAALVRPDRLRVTV